VPAEAKTTAGGTGRPVKVRASYTNDAGFLNRLMQAIEADDARPKAWRDRALSLLRELSSHFLNAPPANDALERRGK
jgi:hypothetical protein